MKTGSSLCSAKISGLKLIEIEINYPHPNIDSLKIYTENGSLFVKYFFKELNSIDEMKIISENISTEIINKISVMYGVSIGEARLVNVEQYSDEIDEKTASIQERIIVSDEVNVTITPGQKSINTLREFLENFEIENSYHLQLFRLASHQNHPVAKYILFYTILLSLHEDSQKKVDLFIKEIDPQVPQTPSPRFNHVNETVFTRLRNEISHYRKCVVPKKTVDEVKQNVSKLQHLARVAIMECIGQPI